MLIQRRRNSSKHTVRLRCDGTRTDSTTVPIQKVRQSISRQLEQRMITSWLAQEALLHAVVVEWLILTELAWHDSRFV